MASMMKTDLILINSVRNLLTDTAAAYEELRTSRVAEADIAAPAQR
jgi:lactate dehydrogenase-like 2-hydroxyacid dehydrogenase